MGLLFEILDGMLTWAPSGRKSTSRLGILAALCVMTVIAVMLFAGHVTHKAG